MKFKLSNGRIVRVTKTGFRIGQGRVKRTPKAVAEFLVNLDKSDRRKVRKALFKSGLKHLIDRASFAR